MGEDGVAEFAGGGGFVGIAVVAGGAFEEVGFFVGDIGDVVFAVALVLAEEVVAGADGQAHEPVFEGGVAAVGAEFLESFDEDFLGDVFDFVFAAGVAADGAKNFRLIFGDELFERGVVTAEGGVDEFAVGCGLLMRPSSVSSGVRGRWPLPGPWARAP